MLKILTIIHKGRKADIYHNLGHGYVVFLDDVRLITEDYEEASYWAWVYTL